MITGNFSKSKAQAEIIWQMYVIGRLAHSRSTTPQGHSCVEQTLETLMYLAASLGLDIDEMKLQARFLLHWHKRGAKEEIITWLRDNSLYYSGEHIEKILALKLDRDE